METNDLLLVMQISNFGNPTFITYGSPALGEIVKEKPNI